MNLAQTLKSIQSMPDSDLTLILSEVLVQAGEGNLKCDIQVSKHYWGWGWNKYRNKVTNGIVDANEYYSKIKELTYERTSQGKYEEEHEPYYDYTVYENHINRLKAVEPELKKMGFSTEIQASQDYKINSEPDSIWFTVSW